MLPEGPRGILSQTTLIIMLFHHILLGGAVTSIKKVMTILTSRIEYDSIYDV